MMLRGVHLGPQVPVRNHKTRAHGYTCIDKYLVHMNGFEDQPCFFFVHRQVAVHVLDHALEFADPAAGVMLPRVVPLLLEACCDNSPSVSLVR